LTNWTNNYSIIFFDELDSTSKEAERFITRGVKGKYLIVASKQTGGFGRSGNEWHSPKGNLYCSIVFDHNNDPASLSQLSFLTSLSCWEVIQDLLYASEPDLFSRSLKIKWPNDLLINEKKFCGILLRSFPHMDLLTGELTNYLVMGIGINLNSSPIINNYPTTSLKEEGIGYISRDEILNKLMEKFNKNYKSWQRKGFSAIRERWLENAYRVGEEVSINVKGEKISGIFKEIDESGQMIIESVSGILHKIITCDA
jgi:BirA family biotin operon repressor/biotin-[acetyl-CoA-carboxylase] ligase